MVGAAAVAALGGGAVLGPSIRPERAVIAFLHRAFPGLDMEPEGLMEFAHEIVARMDMARHRKALHLTLLQYGAMMNFLPENIGEDQPARERAIVTMFLRSTDFLDPARGDAQVQLLAFADPYLAGCANPIPIFLDPQST